MTNRMTVLRRSISRSRVLSAGVLLIGWLVTAQAWSADGLLVGVAETDVTPPTGFPIAGYYHERLATGTLDPLKAKAIVFRDGETRAALVVCDLGAIAADLSREVRNKAAERTGIPVQNMVIAATHSHTAPDYFKDLYLYLAGRQDHKLRSDYVARLIDGIVQAIVVADEAVKPVRLEAGTVRQQVPVAFNRRFVMKDGTARTWAKLTQPNVIRAAGPIDPQISLLKVSSPDGRSTRGVVSNFALHLDTVGGLKWSADYPYFIEQKIRQKLGGEVVSLFSTGCCGDINHSDPTRTERNKTDFIGNALGQTMVGKLGSLRPLEETELRVHSAVVPLPLAEVTQDQVDRAVEILTAAKRQEKVDFYEQVAAYKHIILDQLRNRSPRVKPEAFVSWGLSHCWAGVGEALPVEIQVIALGDEVALVCLPGEVFVGLGLAIKQGSPFRTTLVVELSGCAETLYIPTRAAFAQGSYEVTNSALQPGAGEMLVEGALKLLRQAASEGESP